MKKQQDEISIKDLFNIFLPKLWIVAIVSILFAALLGGYTAIIQKDTYSSVSTFVMVKIPTQYSDGQTNGAVTTGLNSAEIEAMQKMITMSEQVMETNDFLNVIKRALVEKYPQYASISIAKLKEMLSISIDGEATVFKLTAVSTDSALSYAVADVVHDKLPEKIEDVFSSYSIKIKDIDPPREAKAPNSKGTLKKAAIGFIGGAVLSMLAIFVVSKLDVVVRSKEKLEDSFDIPLIGVIPSVEDDKLELVKGIIHERQIK